MRIPALGAALIAVAMGGAWAAEMVVVDAAGIALKPGQVVAGEKPLALAAGQMVSLMAQDGRLLKLTGPSEAAPEAGAPPAGDRSVLAAMKDMVREKQAKTSTLGVTRTGTTQLPDPWLIDVSASGRTCVLEGAPLVFWRPDAQAELPLTVAAGGVKAKAVWPAGAQRLEGPSQLPAPDGQTLTVTVGSRSAEFQLSLVPAAMDRDEMRLAWLVEKDCLAQATALLREIQ